MIHIKHIEVGQPIGSVLDQIFHVMHDTESKYSSGEDVIVWDFSECKTLHPFYAGALSLLKLQYGDTVCITNVCDSVKEYFDLVFFNAPLEIKASANDVTIWDKYKEKNFVPISCFNPNDDSIKAAQSLVEKVLAAQLDNSSSIRPIISYLFAELTDNITEHSRSKTGFIFSQIDKQNEVLYVMILDQGHSIYNSYISDDRYRDSLNASESSGLVFALQGKSTKDRPETENRGYGISRSREMIVKGLGGEFYILSGSAFARHNSEGEVVVDLPNGVSWNGTAILLKIPTKLPPQFNLYNYIS
ncbi:MAG: hypothetical protein K2G74_06305 [Muribaculaceae bacterium]|nr:hypothetical protein [Muribaculaceae bacterium]